MEIPFSYCAEVYEGTNVGGWEVAWKGTFEVSRTTEILSEAVNYFLRRIIFVECYLLIM